MSDYQTLIDQANVPVVGELDCYDAGLLNDFGGGNVEWWKDYVRAELARAHDFYASQSHNDSIRRARLDELLAAEKRVAELERKAHALLQQLQIVHEDPRYKAVWEISQAHAGPYAGPKYELELTELGTALSASRLIKR